MKILWVDDQLDIIKTFSSLLSSLSPEIISAKDGIQALNLLKNQYFNILLLDLKIPPETWGGLWLLEEIRKAKIRIPVIILSGEGTQSETIAALRLGAKDYVTKDNVQTELLQRVCKVIEESTSEIENYISNSFPTPLALPYKRFLNTPSPISRLRRLIEFFESGLRFCCLVGFCELRLASPHINLPEFPTGVLYGPSMGIWNQAGNLLTKYLPNQGLFYRLHAAFNNNTINDIIQIRNDIAHGIEPSELNANEDLLRLEESLRLVVSRWWQFLQFEMVVPTGLRYDGNLFQVNGHVIVGDGNTLPNMNTTVDTPVICNQAYLLDLNSLPAKWINLFPFLCVEPVAGPNSWNILVFDGLKMDKRKPISGDEPIRFVDILTGSRKDTPTSKPNSKILPYFLVNYK